jgi:hypothetical protein
MTINQTSKPEKPETEAPETETSESTGGVNGSMHHEYPAYGEGM